MEQAFEEQEYGSSETASSSQPILKWAQDVSEWAKVFFTLTEDEKRSAGIYDYKDDIF